MDKIITNKELMIDDFFNLELKDELINVSIFKIGKKSVDILVNGEEKVCLINSLIPIKLTDDILINKCEFGRRLLKISGQEINDIFKEINNNFVSIINNNNKYNIVITSINGEKICEFYNVEYLHILQNILRTSINSELTYV